jgi:hypothetical protein
MLGYRGLRIPALAVLALGIVIGLVFVAASAQAGGSKIVRDENGNAGNPRVLPPGSMPYGSSYGEWGMKWWQWAYSLPVTGHPLFDETGADCAAGQSGPVWFLGGVFNVSGSAVRDLCAVPVGKALFFPILNVEWDNFCPLTYPPLSEDELRATARWYMDLATEMSCEVDGRPIYNLTAYRASGGSFGINLPDDNLWQYFGCDVGPGYSSPLVQDGYYLMLAPLPAGAHTLHFRGTVGDPINFTLEITYHLTVSPHAAPGELSGAPADMSVSPAGAPPLTQPSTWGRVKATYR